MTLPTEKTPPKENFEEFTTLIYGEGKIGKSTFCSHAENALFIATEPGLNSLNVYQETAATWLDICRLANEIAAGNHRFKTIIIDTIDNAYKMCAAYICQKFKVAYEGDLGHGKGFAMINTEVMRVMNFLAQLPYGLILVSHSQDKEFDTRIGKIKKTVPTMSPGASKIITALVDFILFCDVENSQDKDGNWISTRVIRTKPSQDYIAGDRTGKLPAVLPLNYNEFKKYFTINK